MVLFSLLLSVGLAGSGATGLESSTVSLPEQCDQTAQWLARQLGPTGQTLVRPPLVLGGDLTPTELERWHREILAPAAQAMQRAYFHTRPDRPVVVLLFAAEESYRQAARRMFGDTDVSAYGYYKPPLRTLLVNTSRGPSGALHELTHALQSFDFPDAPAWLSEGLAALHEDCQILPDRLEGRVNWRLARLQSALTAGTLPPLAELFARPDFDGPDQALCYAYARYFCLYLERRGLLGDVYRRVRDAAKAGGAPLSLAELVPGTPPEQLESDFRRFAAALKE
jgi:hypothetical protein